MLLTPYQAYRLLKADIDAMEQRIMSTLADIKAAEDKVGSDIATAVATNAANVKALADAIANQADPAEIQSLVDEATAHSAALEAAFPAAQPTS